MSDSSTHKPSQAPMERSFHLLVVATMRPRVIAAYSDLCDMGLSHRCHHCHSGQEALEYLHREFPLENAPRLNLILLHVDMPGMNVCEVLRLIKSDPRKRSIPVVMLSSSQSVEEITSCYLAHANAYLSKPTDLAANEAMVRHFDRFWNDCELTRG